jgi:hypothetical protein
MSLILYSEPAMDFNPDLDPSLARSACYLPKGVESDPKTQECNTFALLIPFIAHGISTLATVLLTGRWKTRNAIRFWDRHYLHKETRFGKWVPVNALGSTVMAVVVAIAAALVIRAGGSHVELFPTVLL